MKSRGKVLVVDDDPLALEITRARLESAGFEVTTQATPMGTGAAILRIKPDAVLLDLHMPGLSGDALAQLISRSINAEHHGRDVPVILHSSDDLTSILDRARACGAIGAIRKTADDAAFLAQFDRLYKRGLRRRAAWGEG